LAASHLTGFKNFSGYASERAQIAFRNSDGTVLVIVTGDKGAKGENVGAYSVATSDFSRESRNKLSRDSRSGTSYALQTDPAISISAAAGAIVLAKSIMAEWAFSHLSGARGGSSIGW
jgi:hypothetical protein